MPMKPTAKCKPAAQASEISYWPLQFEGIHPKLGLGVSTARADMPMKPTANCKPAAQALGFSFQGLGRKT